MGLISALVGLLVGPSVFYWVGRMLYTLPAEYADEMPVAFGLHPILLFLWAILALVGILVALGIGWLVLRLKGKQSGPA